MYYFGTEEKGGVNMGSTIEMGTAEKIVDLMKKKDPPLTRAELAKQAGLHRSTISNILNNNKGASAKNLEKIAEALGTTLEYLRGKTSTPLVTDGELPEYALEVLDSMLKLSRAQRYQLMVTARAWVVAANKIEDVTIEEFIGLALDYAEETRGIEATDQVMAFLTELQRKARSSRGLISGLDTE